MAEFHGLLSTARAWAATCRIIARSRRQNSPSCPPSGVIFTTLRNFPFRGEIYKAHFGGGMPTRLPLDRGSLASIAMKKRSAVTRRKRSLVNRG